MVSLSLLVFRVRVWFRVVRVVRVVGFGLGLGFIRLAFGL
jgi:hypothetical protein